MNAVNPPLANQEPAQTPAAKRHTPSSGMAFQQLLSAEIDGRGMEDNWGEGHADGPAQPRTPMPGTSKSAAEGGKDDKPGVPGGEDSPSSAPIDIAALLASALLGMTAAQAPQAGDAALLPDGPHAQGGRQGEAGPNAVDTPRAPIVERLGGGSTGSEATDVTRPHPNPLLLGESLRGGRAGGLDSSILGPGPAPPSAPLARPAPDPGQLPGRSGATAALSGDGEAAAQRPGPEVPAPSALTGGDRPGLAVADAFADGLPALGQGVPKAGEAAAQRPGPEVPASSALTGGDRPGLAGAPAPGHAWHDGPSESPLPKPETPPARDPADSALLPTDPPSLGGQRLVDADYASGEALAGLVVSAGGQDAPPGGAGLAGQGAPELAALAAAQLIPSSHLPGVGNRVRTSDALPQRVGFPDWDHALGRRLVWMAEGAQRTATLTLNPPDLGPLRIVLNLSDNQVGATFISAQPEVRAAIEAAMPRLHQMLESAGLQMGGSSIGSGASNPDTGGGRQAHRQDWPGGQATSQVEPVAGASAATAPASSGQGMIDTHA